MPSLCFVKAAGIILESCQHVMAGKNSAIQSLRRMSILGLVEATKKKTKKKSKIALSIKKLGLINELI